MSTIDSNIDEATVLTGATIITCDADDRVIDDGAIAIVGNTANAGTQGAWQYSSNAGTNWFAVGAVADGATALAVSSASRCRSHKVGCPRVQK